MSDVNKSSESSALARLGRWVSKYKKFELRDGGINPGNEASIRLTNGYRKVYLDEWDFQPNQEDKENDKDKAPKELDYDFVVVSYDDLINRALDIWESDNNLKFYDIFFQSKCAGVWDQIAWGAGQHVTVSLMATNEDHARHLFHINADILYIREKGYVH